MQHMAALAEEDLKQALQRAKDDPEDKRGYEDLKLLAGLGSNGRHPNNMNSELQRKLAPVDLPRGQPMQIPLAAKNSEGHDVFKMARQELMLPHELFTSIYAHYPDAWRKRICPSKGALEEFWTSIEASPTMANHPIRAVSNYKTRAVPILVHGDGVPVTGVGRAWGKSLEILSWCSAFGTRKTIELTFYIYALWKVLASVARGGNTWRVIWRRVHWSFYWLYRGVHPEVDEHGKAYPENSLEGKRAGKPLCGTLQTGVLGVIIGVKGDLEWVYDRLQIGNYRALAQGPCALCPCSSIAPLWNDFRRRVAAWMPHIYTEQATEAKQHHKY